jgi:hypothetical protein
LTSPPKWPVEYRLGPDKDADAGEGGEEGGDAERLLHAMRRQRHVGRDIGGTLFAHLDSPA